MDPRARMQYAAALFKQGAPATPGLMPQGGAAALAPKAGGMAAIAPQGPSIGQQAAQRMGYVSGVKPAVGLVEYGKGPGNAAAYGQTSQGINRAMMAGNTAGIPTGLIQAAQAWQAQDDERKRRQGMGFNPVSGLMGLGAAALGMPAMGGVPGLAGRLR